MGGPAHDYNSAIEYLNTLSPKGLPLHTLTLKRGRVVMLLRNSNLKVGLCNGARLLVLELKPRALKCEILTGIHKADI